MKATVSISSGGVRVFAARGKRLCCRPTNQIISAIRVFFRISDMGCEATLVVSSSLFPSHYLPSPPLFPLTFPFLTTSPPLS